MSHLRAPAARTDRKEGGRHGRPVARTAPELPETHIRPQLMRLAVLPPVAVALSATAAVMFSIRSTGARTGITLWAVLAAAVTVTVAGILIAAVAADRAARSVTERVGALRRSAARGEADLRGLVEAMRRGDTPPQRKPRRRPPADADDFELLAADLARAHDGAVTAVVQAAQLSSHTGSEQKLEVFVNLARRLQSLVHREISILDDLENEIEDPDLLKGLFHVDHLATRIRRHAENLAVLGGAVSRRQWSNPVDMTEVLRSAIAEVEQYSRVKLVPPIDGELRGHAVADVIHLLAELVENATVFSAPHTQVLLRANLVTSGLAVEVEDRGLGMPVGEQTRMNALLADPDQVNVASLLADGRIGLYVVSQLARRHGISVRLQTNIYGGVQAVLVVPQALLGTAPGVLGAGAGAGAGAGVGTGFGSGSGSGSDTGVHGVLEAAGDARMPVPPQQLPSGADAVAKAGVNGSGQPPATGRRRHAQRGGGRGGAGKNGGAENAGTPPPLPVRGAQEQRPNPAEAVPGISAEHRPVVEAHAGAVPTPRDGVVRGTMDKPQLPRRRAQEHIVPQLRGGPAPRQDGDTVPGHDPGLMAAFQRGIGLAEAQQHMEAAESAEQAYGESYPVEAAYMEPTPMGAAPMEPAHIEAAPMGSVDGVPAYLGSADTDAGHTDAAHMDAVHTDSVSMEPADGAAYVLETTGTNSAHMNSAHMGVAHLNAAHMNAVHMGSAPMELSCIEPANGERTYTDPTPASTTPASPTPVDPLNAVPASQPHVHTPAPAAAPDAAPEAAGRSDGSATAG
ncbi:ATP-binding protein [Streptomyces sp. NBC_00820]|uniref:ATP-binding protein n=1 Tax=Streptomyces sp. NBC_00820 TaxID=2975842 RepID=UPI003FA7D2F9|nr:ATP-binding protein [Streptomyces sp. NBC_00820]